MKELRASSIGLLIGATMFAVLCFIFDAPSKEHFMFATFLGGFSGLLAAPEISPESYKYPTIFQVVSGIGIGACVGLFFQASNEYIFGLCIIGAVIGFFAKYFLHAVQIP
jgi:hypothetical protein